MICVKVNKDFILDFISKYKPYIFSIFTDGKSIYIELDEKSEIQGIDCNSIKKRNVPKLSDIIPGVRGYYLLGDILLISPKKEINEDLLAFVILKSNPKVKTVFIREKVEGELRINELKFIGGEYKTSTVYKENGINFYIDVSKVYVNPSLANERKKVSEEVDCKRIILDAFCGYGAFTLYLLKRCNYAVAGDLNIDGLYMLKKSLELNRLKGIVDIIQYDAYYLPFRDGVFELVIADNPTMIEKFKEELCRVGKEVIFYVLAHDEKDATNKLGETNWVKINEYSKDLSIFKGRIRCYNESR